MDWNSFLGHHRQRGWFANAIRSNRLASTFLLVGPDAVGKRTFARMIAKTLLCLKNDPASFDPCGACEACVQVEAGTHPDWLQIEREKGKTALSIDQFIGPEENRMRAGLCYEIRMKPYSGRRKIAVVDDADPIGVEGANSLLKTLEEPPPGSIIFLISTSLQRQLPTIRSRCQVVRFQGLSEDELAVLALRQGIANGPEDAKRIAVMAQGSLASFAVLLDDELREFKSQLLQQFDTRPFDFPKFTKALITNMDSAGSDSQAKRDRLKLLIDFVQQHCQKKLYGAIRSDDTVKIESEVALIKRCIAAKEHVDRIVAPAALVEAWSADLASLCV